jgi:predicted DNA-binding transcriptional regulator YafY
MDNARVLIGWCEMRQAFRFFRTDRILSAEPGDHYPGRRSNFVRDFQIQIRDEPASADISDSYTVGIVPPSST